MATQRGIHLQYSFEAQGQRGAEIENPLFDLLAALREHGSIRAVADALGLSYRHIWGSYKHWEEVLGEPLVHWEKGQRARLTPLAERLLWAERRARTRLTPHIEALRAELERVLADALDGTQQVLAVTASHDLALPRLAEAARSAQGLHLELRFAGSVDALAELAAGRCEVAGLHVPLAGAAVEAFARELKPRLQPGRHKLIACHRRVQGLIVAPGNPHRLGAATDLARSDLRVVTRQLGSGTRLLVDALLAAAGHDPARVAARAVATETTHVAVAAGVAAGEADVGPGIEAAAAPFGLGFVPLVEEAYFLVCLKDALDSEAVRRLRALLAAPAWPALLAALPGMQPPAEAGQVLSLTRALPWWRFRQPKAARRASAARSGTGPRAGSAW